MNRLEKALSGLLSHGELTNRLAQVLAYASERGRVSYREIEKMVNGDAEDVLLLGSEWGLIFLVRTLKSAAWEDRLLVAKPGELYEAPNIIKFLVEDARKTGRREAGRALAELFRDTVNQTGSKYQNWLIGWKSRQRTTGLLQVR